MQGRFGTPDLAPVIPGWPCIPGGWRRWGLPGKGLKIQGLGLTEVWSQGVWGQVELGEGVQP